MPAKVALAIGIEVIVFALLLFGAAGTIDWPAGWAFLLLFFGPALWVTHRLAKSDPALLDERMKPFNQKGQPLWDRIFLALVSVGFVGWLAVMGLDARFAWSAMPLALQILGAMGMGIAWVMSDRVFRANTFLAPVVKIQNERAQTVISTGPYAIVRHPFYTASLLLLLSGALVLGSWAGVAGVVLLGLAIGWRAIGEERELRAHLTGYEQYAQRVRFRLVPGIW